jgi:hypothetical protein
MRYCYIFLAAALLSCTKYLEERPNKAMVVPHSVTDYTALLDAAFLLNVGYPSAGEIGSDNIWVTATDFAALSDRTARHAYIWDRDLFNDNENNDWSFPYQTVLYANTAAEGIEKVARTAANASEWDNVKGTALFFRAFAFYNLAQQFCVPYNEATAATDMGIPIRLSPDLSSPSRRASVEATYRQIMEDARAASGLLPITPLHRTRPSKGAAFALLARTALTMGQYSEAVRWGDSCLALPHALLDYNTLSATVANPLRRFNSEVLFHATLASKSILTPTIGKIDSLLYRSYATNDLRRTLFFKATPGGVSFYGSYDGTNSLFGGIALDEVYLIKAEGEARLGRTADALSALNALLVKRYRTGTFVPVTASSAEAALRVILEERLKELLLRGLRWSDLRRLNRESDKAVEVKRVISGMTYVLPPDDRRYTLPLPEKAVQLGGIPQNP